MTLGKYGNPWAPSLLKNCTDTAVRKWQKLFTINSKKTLVI